MGSWGSYQVATLSPDTGNSIPGGSSPAPASYGAGYSGPSLPHLVAFTLATIGVAFVLGIVRMLLLYCRHRRADRLRRHGKGKRTIKSIPWAKAQYAHCCTAGNNACTAAHVLIKACFMHLITAFFRIDFSFSSNLQLCDTHFDLLSRKLGLSTPDSAALCLQVQ